MLDELTADVEGITFGTSPETVHEKLQPILSNASIFGSDLYAAGIGERIEELFCEEIQGPGAVRAALVKHLAD